MSTKDEQGDAGKPDEGAQGDHKAPKGTRTEHALEAGGETIVYDAVADWIVLRKEEKPAAEMFHVAYLARDRDASKRPVTFVFNGGPGAASAYLHVGAIGPKRVPFNEDGTAQRPPTPLVDNTESWLAFTDLVFIDPIGTGFSRVIKPKEPPQPAGAPPPAPGAAPPEVKDDEYWKLNRDLQSLGEFVQRFLSKHGRWGSPIFVAGESYGGFRAAKLARSLQEGYGVGLNGAILISPALEWILLNASDYDVLAWIGTFPTMVAGAFHHGRCTAFDSSVPLAEVLAGAERFATEKLAPLLILGDDLAPTTRAATIAEMSALLGIDSSLLDRCAGRIDILTFARELLRDRGQFCGLYDVSVTTPDPFPDRANFEGPDPTLYAIERVFTAGINAHLRQNLELESDREYHLLNFKVNSSWQLDGERHVFQRQVGATDDLRYGMALNPHLKVWITHGYYDLVTPYYSSNRLAKLLRLDPTLRENLTVEHFEGGHMFYAWEESRRAFCERARKFVGDALA